MEKVIIECAVKGQRRPGFMCGSIIVGNKTCGDDSCVEPVKQEPVAWMDLHKELGQFCWLGVDEGWNLAVKAVQKRLEELAAAPVDAKTIRAEALEEAAKVCDGMYRRDGIAKRECDAADECAAAIRGLK